MTTDDRPAPRGSDDDPGGVAAAAARGGRTLVWGIVASSGLGAIKVLAGVAGNSYALVADGIESLLDVVSSLVVWSGLRLAARPASDTHPYGYGKAEPLAALVVATALLAAAIGISIQSVREIRTPHHGPAAFTLFVLVGVVIAKEVMFRVLSRTGASIGSTAMQADAWHHRSDSLTSLAAFIGITVALLGGPGYESADDWAALSAAAVIAYNATRLFRMALRDVLDVAPSAEVVELIRTIAADQGQVAAIEKCRVRRSGLGVFVDIHVLVDGNLPVREGHAIAHRVKDALLASSVGVLDVTVHVEPDDATA